MLGKQSAKDAGAKSKEHNAGGDELNSFARRHQERWRQSTSTVGLQPTSSTIMHSAYEEAKPLPSRNIVKRELAPENDELVRNSSSAYSFSSSTFSDEVIKRPSKSMNDASTVGSRRLDLDEGWRELHFLTEQVAQAKMSADTLVTLLQDDPDFSDATSAVEYPAKGTAVEKSTMKSEVETSLVYRDSVDLSSPNEVHYQGEISSNFIENPFNEAASKTPLNMPHGNDDVQSFVFANNAFRSALPQNSQLPLHPISGNRREYRSSGQQFVPATFNRFPCPVQPQPAFMWHGTYAQAARTSSPTQSSNHSVVPTSPFTDNSTSQHTSVQSSTWYGSRKPFGAVTFPEAQTMRRAANNAAESSTTPSGNEYLSNSILFGATDYEQCVQRLSTYGEQRLSVWLQQQLRCGDENARKAIIIAVIRRASLMIKNRFGNFVVQVVIEVANEREIEQLISVIEEDILSLSLDSFGSHVIQKVVEICKEGMKLKIIERLLDHVMETIQNKHACHVWQRILRITWSTPQPQILASINSSSCGKWATIAKSEGGSLICQNVFENCAAAEKQPCIEEILSDIVNVGCSHFGNFVITVCVFPTSCDLTSAQSTSSNMELLKIQTEHLV